MECIARPDINCCPGGNCDDSHCPSTHSCCWQDTGNGTSATLGLCVLKHDKSEKKNFNCDRKRGIPRRGCKDPKNRQQTTDSYENFQISQRENYGDKDCNCSDWNRAFIMTMVIVCLMLFLVLVFFSRKSGYSRK